MKTKMVVLLFYFMSMCGNFLIAMERQSIPMICVSSLQGTDSTSSSPEPMSALAEGIRRLSVQPRKRVCRQCGNENLLERPYGCDHLYCPDCKSKNQKRTCPVCSERGKACTVCLETIKNPSALVCGHVFCAECITEHLRCSKEKICPDCREMVHLKKDVVRDEICLYCREKFDENKPISYITCDEEIHFWGIFPTFSWRKVNHYFHGPCLAKFIMVSSVWSTKGEKIFLCQIHRQEHLSDKYLRIAERHPVELDLPQLSPEERRRVEEKEYHAAMAKTLV